MKKILTLFMMMLAVAVVTACSDDKNSDTPDRISLIDYTSANQTFEADASTSVGAIKLYAVADWTSRIEYVSSSQADWLTVTPAAGASGKSSIDLKVTKTFYDSPRKAKIVFISDGWQITVTVTQKAGQSGGITTPEQ